MGDKKLAVVIDDESDICDYIASVLTEHGFETRTANEARGGEDLIRDAMPDLVCLDLMMPGRTGIQLFARLKGDETTKELPVIMITGIKDKLNIDWGEIAGGLRKRKPDGFIEKPIDPVRLMRVVEDVLEHPKEGVQYG
ncbi:MAG: response regulator [Deltaproteobacteria bacterium]|jgi:two-component system phosphate regulon response regulator PhoB|nr:response regulator [Deltaproteobacteria bacterium]MBW2536937.1 response regulator [Deltaproteobacteria bacterium]